MGTPPRRHGDGSDDDDGAIPQTLRAIIGQRQWERSKREAARSVRYEHATRLATVVMWWVLVLALTAFAVIGLLAAWKHWR